MAIVESLLSVVLELSLALKVLAIAVALLASKALYSWLTYDFNPNKLPVVGLPSGPFGRIRAIPKLVTNTKDIVFKGYYLYQYQKEDPQAFIIPHLLTGYTVVLPPTLVAEYKSAPENVLSMAEAFEYANGSQYSFGSKLIVDEPYHGPIIRQKLTGSLDRVLGPLQEEIDMAFREEWESKWESKKADDSGSEKGDAGGWNDVKAFEEVMDIVARASNRTFVGAPLCHDKAFLKNAIDYAMGIVMCGFGFQLFPLWIRRYIAPFITFTQHKRVKKSYNIMRPTVEQRVALHEHNCKPGLSPKEQIDEPEDLLQWIIQQARTMGPEHYNTHSLCLRYLTVNFAAIHTTSLTFTHVFVKLASCKTPQGESYVKVLREEIEAVEANSSEPRGVWNKKKLNKLVGLDSFIRETLRLEMTGMVGMTRHVVPKEGHTFSNGLHLRQGTSVCLPSACVHRSEGQAYGEDFDGFRYSPPFHQLLAETGDAEKISAIGGVGKLAAVTTSNNYLAFAHGTHACPGRFFAVNEVKLLTKYCLINYEIKPMEHPQPEFFFENQSPPFNVLLRMKKRTLV